jgi:hypothetical protein
LAKRNFARRANLSQGDGQWLVTTIFARPALAVIADVCGFRVGDVLANGKALAKALSEGIIEEADHGEEEKN